MTPTPITAPQRQPSSATRRELPEPSTAAARAERAAITIRAATDRDGPMLRRLAERDAASVPPAPLLVAEVEGRPLAAISLADGRAIADPFLASGSALDLLRLRARHLRRTRRPHRGLLRRLGRRQRARAALAGSPPGVGGRLLQL